VKHSLNYGSAAARALPDGPVALLGLLPGRISIAVTNETCQHREYEPTFMRKLQDYEEIGLIGYPSDGEYIAVIGEQDCLLGGELCGLEGAPLAQQAASLPRYYPSGIRLVLVTVQGDRVVAIRDYDSPRPEI
jgi:hypothetical protein